MWGGRRVRRCWKDKIGPADSGSERRVSSAPGRRGASPLGSGTGKQFPSVADRKASPLGSGIEKRVSAVFGAGRVPRLPAGRVGPAGSGTERHIASVTGRRAGAIMSERESWRHRFRKGETGRTCCGKERLGPSFPETRDRFHRFPDRKRSGGRSWTGKGQSIGARGKAG